MLQLRRQQLFGRTEMLFEAPDPPEGAPTVGEVINQKFNVVRDEIVISTIKQMETYQARCLDPDPDTKYFLVDFTELRPGFYQMLGKDEHADGIIDETLDRAISFVSDMTLAENGIDHLVELITEDYFAGVHIHKIDPHVLEQTQRVATTCGTYLLDTIRRLDLYDDRGLFEGWRLDRWCDNHNTAVFVNEPYLEDIHDRI